MRENINVLNMPLNTLYKFAHNRYVYASMLNSTRLGDHYSEEPARFTEVYEIDSNGDMVKLVSGKLIDNSRVFNLDKTFIIYDYDQDLSYAFDVQFPLEEATIEELEKLKEALNKMNNNKKKEKRLI